jgi:hypothetical protein
MTGIVLLCQLKHQDPYGASIHAERTRGERLVEQAQLWLTAVDVWLNEIGIEGLQEALRVNFPLSSRGIYRLVIARYFAHQLKDTATRSGMLYATLAQMRVAATAAIPDGPPRDLAALVGRVMEIPRFQSAYEYEAESQSSWQVGDLKFLTLQRE